MLQVTTKLLGLTYRGSKSNVITIKGFQQVSYYGKGKFSDRELQKLLQYMILERFLDEELPHSNENRSTPYVHKGINSEYLLDSSFYFKCYK